MIVYRIENIHHIGMYGGDSIMFDNIDVKRHPGPANDSRLVRDFERKTEMGFYVPTQYYFGFKNIAQLRSWLYDDDWLCSLHDSGYSLVEIYISDCKPANVIIGNTQVMFDKSMEIKRDTFSLVSYFNLEDGNQEQDND